MEPADGGPRDAKVLSCSRDPCRGHLTDLEGELPEVNRELQLNPSRNWVYYDALRTKFQQLHAANDVVESKAEKEDVFVALLAEFMCQPNLVHDLREFRSDPEWSKIRKIRDQYSKAIRNVQETADRLNRAIRYEIQRGIVPYWCMPQGRPNRKKKKKVQ